jgi:AsmA protein
MKRALIAVAILLVILLIAALAIPFFVNANQFRPRLQSEASQALGRNVTVGDLQMSLLAGGVTASDISIADDPAFSKNPFLGAKSVKIGVELMPLIFSRKLIVTGIEIEQPEIAFIQSSNGNWNFSTLGRSAQSQPQQPPLQPRERTQPQPPAQPQPGGSLPEFTVKFVKITGGRASLRSAGEARPQVLDNVNFTARDFSPSAWFPFSLSAAVQGGGELKLDGKAGPISTENTESTPFTAKLRLARLNLVGSGFVKPGTGLGGLVTIDGNVDSNGQIARVTGNVEATQLKLAKNGKPAAKPVAFAFQVDHDLARRTGELKRGELSIGTAKAALTGAYRMQGPDTLLNMKIAAPSMLPALDVQLPAGSSLQGGTLTLNATSAGPADKLVTDGSFSLNNTRLAGFDLGSEMRTVSQIAGLPIGRDTDIQTASAVIHDEPSGLTVTNIRVVAPALGELTGAGSVSPAKDLNFKMRANLHTHGGVTELAGLKGDTVIPFSIQGTASSPKFVPDIRGLATEQLQQQLKGVQPGNVGGIVDLFRKKKPQK